ncbi:MAG TPA: hypothetical protein VLJ59_01375 [Mycobacteriales bacterium]|nr:hypothetical protein [Mycobacteriales bacterium]
MPNFTVDPTDLKSHARFLDRSIAPTYARSSQDVRSGSHIDAPGFGIALSPIEAAYHQRVDFLAKDLVGAHDLCVAIARRLTETAETYQRSEDLNTAGFGGTPVHEESYGSAYAETGAATMASGSPALLAAGITVEMITACLASMAACSVLCPAFIPATIAAGLFFANPAGIATAGAHLINEGRNIQNVLDVNFLNVCTAVAAKWTGEGRDGFQQVATTIKGHLDQVGKYLETLGGALHTLDVALAGLWTMLIALVGPFLLWLIAAKAAELFPPDIPVIEAIINASGAAMSSGILTAIAAVAAIGGAVGTLITALAKDALGLTALPDSGQAGVPDMTEFKVDANFQIHL